MMGTTSLITPTQRIQRLFADLSARGEMGLLTYFMAGYPTLDESLILMRNAADAGADLIEIGIPHSDPIADGPTIQRASTVALNNKFELPALIGRLIEDPLPAPSVIMSYLNPLLAYGRDQLMTDLVRAGVCGLIIPDLPPEESEPWRESANAHALSVIHLIAPTSTRSRIENVIRLSDAFIYAVSVAGTTGARKALPAGTVEYLKMLTTASTVPVAVGFGIAEPTQIRSLQDCAAAVIVGSRLIEAIEREEDLVEVIRELKSATRKKNP